MAQSTTTQKQHDYTCRAPLVALGMTFSQLGVFRPIAECVQITQKVVKYTPVEKLMDALMSILAGAHGLVEANKRVRPGPPLQRAFGRDGCAEQSVISETLNASTPQNVEQIQQAMKEIYQCHRADGSWWGYQAQMWFVEEERGAYGIILLINTEFDFKSEARDLWLFASPFRLQGLLMEEPSVRFAQATGD